jgi:hypothetical protein
MALLSLTGYPRAWLGDPVGSSRRLAPLPTSCPRCRGQFYRDLDGDHCCLNCGEYCYLQPAPPLDVVRAIEERPRRGRPRKHPAVA